MIGYLKGILLQKAGPILLINVQGVGYKVFASSDVLAKYHKNDAIEVYVHTHVREDILELYGFLDNESLTLFELLISVNGIGPKTAIGIFSVGKKEDILSAIRKADTDFFEDVPRLGKKNAQKIIIDLKNKLGSIEELDLGEEDEDVLEALIGFGFSKEEARLAVKQVGETGSVDEKVKLALKYLGKKK